MEQKIKLREVAASLGIEPAKVAEIIKTYTGADKKPTSVITGGDADIVLERVTQDNQVANFDDVFNSRKPKPKPKPEPVAAPAAAAKPAEAKKAKSETGSALPSKNAPAAASETVKDAATAVKPEVPLRPQKIEKHTVKTGNRQPLPRSAPGSAPRTAPPQPKPAEKPAATPAQRQQKQKVIPRQMQAAVDVTKLKVNEPPQTAKAKGETVTHGAQVVKRVDTRGTYAELDKYNERYEKIAPTSVPGVGKKGAAAVIGKVQKFQQNKQQKGGKFQTRQRETDQQRKTRLELEKARKQQLKVLIPDEIIIADLAQRLKVTASEVIKRLFKLGVMATINEAVDFDAAALVAEELGAKVERQKTVTLEERLFEEVDDTQENVEARPPVVVVMGHVDHGKTSLLDRIRHANVVSGEAGGITQHIGAYRVTTADGREITFLDTPGHEAFTAMRARGASVTDIAVLVVAADDGIMPQTVEAINHAKAANVSIIVAINKIDKDGANPEKIKQELTEYGLVIEAWGGDVICCEVSAKQGIGIENLLEMIALTADVRELKANPHCLAVGTVIEARLDKGRGPVATLLVQKGTLKTGDAVIAGTSVGRVRVMRDDKGRTIKQAGPSTPVEIMGLSEAPGAGDTFAVVENEKLARELVEKRRFAAKEEQFKLYKKVSLENLFNRIEDGSIKELPLVIKADVQGSVEAVRTSLEKLTNNEVRVRVIHGAVGAVSESDVMLASASGAIVIGFNVRPIAAAADKAKRDGVDIRSYTIIYKAIEEVEEAMKGLLAPKYREVEAARIEVRNVFKITGVGIVAGCYVLDGKVNRHCEVRVVRDGVIVGTDKISGLKRFKDDVKDVASGYECGISLDKLSDIKEHDIFEAYNLEEYR